MITNEQLKKLQELAAIQLEDTEVEEFKDSLSSIIAYLNKLQEVQVEEDFALSGVTWNYIQAREWEKNCKDSDALLANVEHEIIGNSITITSFVDKE